MKDNKVIRSTQRFTPEYIEYCARLSVKQRAQFVEDFKKIYFSQQDESVLISMRISRSLLRQIKLAAESQGLKYQTLIKQLLTDYVNGK